MMEPADTVARAFLSVERSATEQRWVSRLDQAGQNRALAMSQIHAIPELIARVLAGRGWVSMTPWNSSIPPSAR